MQIIFKSDTVTKATKEMLQAMYNVKVGDDSRKDVPTTIKLEAYNRKNNRQYKKHLGRKA